jgi:alpha-tubulin suppressor-like RCC1 family protein
VIKQVSAGSFHSCAVKGDDTVTCWGTNFTRNAPVGTFRSVSAGAWGHVRDQRHDTVTCWGKDYTGTQFVAATQPRGAPAPPSGEDVEGALDAPPGAFKQVSAGVRYACAIATDDTLACWGRDQFGESDPPAGKFKQVSSSRDFYLTHTCGVRADDTLACWGSNYDGQVNAPSGTFKQVSAGTRFNCAIRNAVVKPSTRRCASRRHFKIHIRERSGFTIARATVSLNGKRVRAFKRSAFRSRKHAAMVDLRGLPKGKFTVRIVVTGTDGRVLRGSRTCRTCALRG